MYLGGSGDFLPIELILHRIILVNKYWRPFYDPAWFVAPKKSRTFASPKTSVAAQKLFEVVVEAL